jgi:uncharacterized protein (TIGR02118 family)
MLKFMVVVYRKPGMSVGDFQRYLREVHGPLAKKLPGLRKYVQNFAADDSTRKRPPWDAIVELYFDDHSNMKTAWSSPEGAASDADLPAFADLTRTSWAIVEETVVLE